MSLARVRLILWILVAVAAIGATAIFFFKPPTSPIGLRDQPFTLTATSGETFTEKDLRGTPSLVFFGYTFCPDVCPTTLAEIVAWREELGLGPDKLRTIFITVDPERDTLPILKDYLGGFDPSVVGLAGTAEETEKAKAAFGAVSEKAGEGEFYLVNHTASVFLLNRDGGFEGTIAYGEDRDAAIAKIKRLVAG